MGLINAANLIATQIGFRTIFQQAYTQFAPPEVPLLALEVPSTMRKEQYKWLASLPIMREWLNDAQFEQFEAFTWEILNKTWQTGIEVDREDIEDDALGLILPLVATMGEEARRHQRQLIVDLIANGDTALGYDGQFYFDTDHTDSGAAIQSNKITGVLNSANFNALRTAMRRFKDAKGRLMGMKLTHLVVPPELENTARTILEAERLASGASNVDKGLAQLLVLPELTNAIKFYGFDLSRPLKPFLFQMRRPVDFAAQDNPTDEKVFSQKKFRYKADGRYNAGYALWQLAIMSTGA